MPTRDFDFQSTKLGTNLHTPTKLKILFIFWVDIFQKYFTFHDFCQKFGKGKFYTHKKLFFCLFFVNIFQQQKAFACRPI